MKDFVAQGFKAQHDAWRYIVGTVLIFVIWQFGQLPFAGIVSWKLLEQGESISSINDYSVMMNTLSKNLTFFLLMFSFVIGFFGIWFVVKFIHQQHFLEVITTRKNFDWKRFFVGFSLIAVLIVVATLVDFYTSPEDYSINFNLVPFLILAVIGIILVPIQTSFEEIYFRGYLMQGLGTIFKNRAVPFVLTSVVFGMLHFFNPEVDKIGNIIMISYIGTGFLLAIFALMDEGLELSLGFHAANNLVTALLVTADWTAFQTESILISEADPSVNFDVLVPVLVIYPIYVLILAKIYKWKNWKQKLFGKVNPPVEMENI
ncbi:CPBP family intramembrane glutamic endopeptidase [Psychroflexus planctonicus]|uniref:Abortive infection protein n=1 Tax=Psychroflexus planctonicus TaxID=1526575 RepID=A0ABQ1SN79_9FLAO|nr:CPBP family intramembrane glutamic endopeptidase [Psychroflexus planctonicus]GGE44671.1 abortive infection protein [Psychroflexus planctonicus]